MNYGRISLNYPGSVKWQQFLAHRMDNIQKLAKSPDYLFGEVKQPSSSRLTESMAHCAV